MYQCDDCGKEFDINKGGAVCPDCETAFCPDCEGKFFANSPSCVDCLYDDMTQGMGNRPKPSERIW